ncbi:sensor domain-containing protein [Parasporobacterium paucivorans]|uniref:PAS domain S-box-containing protein n=1 Tax=Parasporobacterium paucivorans DSM 15970 TaxID=1122934 RepID=A0A1M6GZM6_9FIRM|nr:GGDEF domain-containing phosphodiesterase [Parasporobacterium paucivorans]SHJ15372.1 PAS domain S-box-containing protein [Parasporobacterium paucivorans DSM 15970]
MGKNVPNFHIVKKLETQSAKRKTMMITVVYFLFGCTWIVVTDFVARSVSGENVEAFMFSVTKGIIYVCITAVLIYGLVYSALRKLMNSELRLTESEALFHTIFDQSPIGVAIIQDIPGKMTNKVFSRINPMFGQITGRDETELKATEWDAITHPEDLGKARDLFEKLKLGEIERYTLENRCMKPDGSINWVEQTVTPLNIYDNSTACSYLALVRDIHERKTTLDTLREVERSKSVLLSNLPGMAYRCKYDPEWTMLFVSEGCFSLTGYTPKMLIGNRNLSFKELIVPRYRDYLEEEWKKALVEKKQFQAEYEILTAEGQTKWVLEMGQIIFDENNLVEALEGILIDITARKEQERMLKYFGVHDPLTGLYNRRHLEELLGAYELTGDKVNRALAVLRFKKLNSLSLAYGYQFSENLLRELASSLSVLTGKSCRLFQVSFERMAFYITGYDKTEYLSEFCGRIRNLREIESVLELTGCGIGVLELDEWDCDAAEAIKNASIAAEQTVNGEGSGSCFFTEDLRGKVIRGARIKAILLEAAFTENDDTLYLEYQPLLDLKTNKIAGLEALARLRDEKLGVISPAEFIPLAEEMQLILPLGQKIIRLAFGLMNRLEKSGYGDVQVNVNISGIQLIQEDFTDGLIRMAQKSEVNLKNLVLEITESVLSDNYEAVNERLGRIKTFGVRVAIDDFGTGYSSLARARELNADYLKIDKCFVDNLLTLSSDETIVGDIISMAHRMGHCVVAEGVEDERQYQYLKEHGCDYIQGYYFSRALAPEKVMELIKGVNSLTVAKIREVSRKREQPLSERF